jgi:hypothetical protein
MSEQDGVVKLKPVIRLKAEAMRWLLTLYKVAGIPKFCFFNDGGGIVSRLLSADHVATVEARLKNLYDIPSNGSYGVVDVEDALKKLPRQGYVDYVFSEHHGRIEPFYVCRADYNLSIARKPRTLPKVYTARIGVSRLFPLLKMFRESDGYIGFTADTKSLTVMELNRQDEPTGVKAVFAIPSPSSLEKVYSYPRRVVDYLLAVYRLEPHTVLEISIYTSEHGVGPLAVAHTFGEFGFTFYIAPHLLENEVRKT